MTQTRRQAAGRATGRSASTLVGRLGAIALSIALAVSLSAAGAAPAVKLDLSARAPIVHLAAGDATGMDPIVLHVHVGDQVRFVNADPNEHHSATGLGTATRFVDPRWTDAALKPSGAIGPDPWSTGDLAPGASVQLLAATPGTYLYGCFFHYSAGMRGEIIVEP